MFPASIWAVRGDLTACNGNACGEIMRQSECSATRTSEESKETLCLLRQVGGSSFSFSGIFTTTSILTLPHSLRLRCQTATSPYASFVTLCSQQRWRYARRMSRCSVMREKRMESTCKEILQEWQCSDEREKKHCVKGKRQIAKI
jgi:hypothetical protein